MQSAAGLPFLLSEGLEVAFVPPALDAPRRACVESVQMRDDRTAFVTFAGICSIDVAERLAGCSCLARRADLPEGELEAQEVDWTGWEVHDASAGLIGSVSCILEMPGQMLLEVAAAPGFFEARHADLQQADSFECSVQADSGKHADEPRMILIPLVDEFVVSVDEDDRRIDVDVPSGLLDL